MSLYLKEQYKIILFLIIMYIKLMISKSQKCYSIYKCKKCPEIDICEICLKGYFLNKKKNKCIKSSFSLSNTFPIVSRFKSSENFFSKKNTSSTLKHLDRNFKYSTIKSNIKEIILHAKNYNIIKVSYISSDSLKKENENIPIYFAKFNQSMTKINANSKYSDNDFYFRITIAWIVLLIVVLVILLKLYFSKKARERIEYIHEDPEEISRIVNIR